MKKLCVLVALLCGLLASPVRANLVITKTFEDIAAQSDVLATCEVLEDVNIGPVDTKVHLHESFYQRRCACLKVLRISEAPGRSGLAPQQIFSLEYIALDRKYSRWIDLEALQPLPMGAVYVFPLLSTQDGWELLINSTYNRLLPAVRQPIFSATATNGADFLAAELAGNFVFGDYNQICEAGRCLSDLSDRQPQNIRAVYNLTAECVRKDEKRWLDIVVGCYCASHWNLPPLTELIKAPKSQRGMSDFIAKALLQIPSAGRDDRLIENAITHASTAGMLSINYAHHPAMIPLLNAALSKNSLNALAVANRLIRDKKHPSLPFALKTARFVLTPLQNSTTPPPHAGLATACRLIRDYGSDQDFTILLDAMRQTQKTDSRGYMILWSTGINGDGALTSTTRFAAIARLAFDDQTQAAVDLHYCDWAVLALQDKVGVDFGMRVSQGIEERTKSITKAKEWLSKQP